MSQDNEVNKSQAINKKTTLNTYNPREPISTDDLTRIIATHDKLQSWNNKTDLALQSDIKNNHSDPVLIQNIRNTAALIISSGRSTHSQNFELRRAINLSSSTLSISATSEAFANGVIHEATEPLRQIVDMQQPGSMSIKESNKRADDLENMIIHFSSQAFTGIKQLPSTLSNAAITAWEDPDSITRNIAHAANHILETYSQNINKLPAVIADGLTNKNPEQAIGFDMGVVAFGAITDMLGAAKKQMRDFSELMQFTSNGSVHTVTYAPTADHYIKGSVINGTLRFDVKKTDGNTHGFGDEMFISMIETFNSHNIKILRLQAAWDTEGPKSTNGRQYLDAIAAGMSKENAAFQTYTGQQAKTLEMDNVIVPPMVPIDKTIHPQFYRSKDQHSSINSQSAMDIIVGHLRTLGWEPEKEQIAMAHIKQTLESQISRDDSISA